ncbi:hypothetical protein NC653_041036 [Populus alba x Populus x berolinensis]|uniref:Uncharacterized protein n=1 Tax=Populus alba x Populus x berolinensis TaxID=444605 RepID=A0AAD6L7H2_9ROSI|nr:hypothetical protein NC653_041036 [Populus alba x Populus x berolinensis]
MSFKSGKPLVSGSLLDESQVSPLRRRIKQDKLTVQGKDKTSEERRIAICIFDEHYNMVPMSLSCKKPAINDENPDVRQAAVYGIGICAGLGGSGSVTCWSGGHVMVLSGKRQRPVQVPTASASNVIVSWGCCCLCSASKCCVLNFLSSVWFSICG